MDAKTTEWRAGPNVCRCCLTEGCYKDISTEYFWMGKREVYAEMLSDALNVSIAYSQSGGPNSNSRLICELCISRLRDSSDFKRQVLECEKTFMQHLDASSSAIPELEVQIESADTDVKLERVKQEKRLSDVDDFDEQCGFDDDDDDLDDQPLTKLASKIPKKESVDLLDLLDNTKATEKRKSSTKTKSVPAKKAKTVKKEPGKAGASKGGAKLEKKKKGIIQKSNSTITLKDEDGKEIKLTVLKYPIPLNALQYEPQDYSTIKTKRKMKIGKMKHAKKSNVKLENISLLKEPVSINNVDWENCSEQENSVTFNVKTVQGYIRGPTRQRNEIVDYETWKQNALVIFENSYVYPFIHAANKYKCVICSKPFLDANLLKDHTINEHTIKDMKQALNNRVRDKNLKVDVTYLQCRICLQSLPDLQNLKTHLREHGKRIQPESQDNIIPYKLGGENFECQVCGEKYLKLRLLIIHMSNHYNNYSCEICGSVFISLQLLKRHLQIHETGSFPCNKCDKVFTNSTKRSLHCKGVHLKQFPRRCPICPERFNSNYQRTKHLRIAHNQSTGLYRCDTCGREYDLKYHLLVHIRSVHLQERNHECPMCNSRFFSKYCLSRHMVTHTGEKNFKCEVCGKAYARRKNLRDHCRSHEVGMCVVCGLSCGDHNSLVAHVNSMH